VPSRSTERILDDLTRATALLDRSQVAALSRELVQVLAAGFDPETRPQKALDVLRRGRFFAEMLRVGDALRSVGADSPKVRRHYAQALIEQGQLGVALDLLQGLVRDTADDPEENAEARGLIGRVHKQHFVAWSTAGNPAAPDALRKAVEAYLEVYRADPSKTWHGINVTALLARASRDEVRLDGYPAPEALATAILGRIEGMAAEERPTWDLATAMEACVALGHWEAALGWARDYVAGERGGFAIGSTHRQLVEIWQLDAGKGPAAELLALLVGALVERDGGSVSMDGRAMAENAAAGLKLEKRFGPDGFVGQGWFKLGLTRANAVARIETRTGDGIGSGFLVRAGDLRSSWGDELVVMTNAHVVSDTCEGALRHAASRCSGARRPCPRASTQPSCASMPRFRGR
jgi:Tetratricopeptide Repeats-Sensor